MNVALFKRTIVPHTYTSSIKKVLGDHVNQAGSLVEADRLRFDFSHFGPMSQEEIDQVERRVNEEIWRGIDVRIQEMGIDEGNQWVQWLYLGKNMATSYV